MIGFGQTETADLFAFCKQREPFAFLVFGAERKDRIHNKSALDADKAAQSAVASLKFLHDQAVGDIVHVGASELFGQVAAQKPEFRQLGNEFGRESCLLEMLIDDRKHALIDKTADAVAYHAFLIRQQIVHAVKIDSSKRHNSSSSKTAIIT